MKNIMPTNKAAQEIKVDDLVTKSVSVQAGPDLYSNFAQVSISFTELILDFYKVAAEPGRRTPKAVHLQRVMLSMNIAKGLSSALTDIIAQFEADNHVELVDSRLSHDQITSRPPQSAGSKSEEPHDE